MTSTRFAARGGLSVRGGGDSLCGNGYSSLYSQPLMYSRSLTPHLPSPPHRRLRDGKDSQSHEGVGLPLRHSAVTRKPHVAYLVAVGNPVPLLSRCSRGIVKHASQPAVRAATLAESNSKWLVT